MCPCVRGAWCSGQLPKPFGAPPNGTSALPSGFNLRNREERDRYVKDSACHYLVDLDRKHQQEQLTHNIQFNQEV